METGTRRVRERHLQRAILDHLVVPLDALAGSPRETLVDFVECIHDMKSILCLQRPA